MIRQFELVEKIKSYSENADEGLINKAYVFAMKAHGSQVRESGDLYFTHPLEVANILTDLCLDSASIATALLHDTVEDTVATLDEIEEIFGKEVASLVDGVTKLSLLELQCEKTKQAENLRKLILAISSDIRVLLVKLADRLHNMRTLHFCKIPQKRQRIAQETMEIYVPLAERIGLNNFKDEMEDLAFAVLHPEIRDSIVSRLQFVKNQSKTIVENVVEKLRNVLSGNMQIISREKTPYSIWRKMHTKNLSFEQLSDIMAFRIIVDSVEECYQVLGILHHNFRVSPGSFKDYISTPKPNNYRSIHSVLLIPGNQRIEVQIRTREMHEIAEIGVAAHWQYKQGLQQDGKQYVWIRELLEILENAADPEEFFEHTKLEMFPNQVFCFTPHGELKSLPKGATPIDFAYAIHSAVGDSAVAAKINGRQMPLKTILQNGDQVEIITSKNQTPSPTWERFVVTGKARTRIRKFIRNQQKLQFHELGKNIVGKIAEKKQINHDELIGAFTKLLKIESEKDFFQAVGEGRYSSKELLDLLNAKDYSAKKVYKYIPKPQVANNNKFIYATCCHPLPGDKICGVIDQDSNIIVHVYDCEFISYTEANIRDLSWASDITIKPLYEGRIRIVIINKAGSLAHTAGIIAKENGNIVNIKIINKSDDFWDILVDIEVTDVEHLQRIIVFLRANFSIHSVERV